MKKHAWLSAILCSIALIAGNVAPAKADAVKVVTLGADLTQDQKDTMLRYFKVNSNEVQILSITNADERAHLSKYFSDSVIGTRTVSCAYVKPTTSGGIKVRTANLNKVTCNMIASILSTSGVSNCEVVAACPFEVSGTGALTGIMMAYETASGETLDETKKEIATEELAVTADLVEEVGQDEATTVINQSKMEVVGNDIQNGDEIYNTVINISQQNGVNLTPDQVDTIVSLLEEIAEQDYDYEEMKETLENVEENVTGDSSEQVSDEEEDPDSIVSGLDESILGDNVIAGSTEDPSVAEQSEAQASADEDEWEVFGEENEGTTEENTGAEIEVGETYDEQNQSGDLTEEPAQAEEQDQTEEDALDIDSLDDTQIGLYNHVDTFTRGEYQGDMNALYFELGDAAVPSEVTLIGETGEKLSKEVLKLYLNILKNGTDSYEWAETDKYVSTELNMLDQQLRRLFTIDDAEPLEGTEDILEDVDQEDRDILYKETMDYFAKLYKEPAAENTEETTVETTAEEVPAEENLLEDAVVEEEVYE